jgi:general secretion pathway protein J
MIIAIVFGGLRVGVRAWERGEKDIDSRQRIRVILELINHQIKSTHLYFAREKGQKYILFKGDNKSLRFVSNISLIPGNERLLTYVNLVVKKSPDGKKEGLIFCEKKGPLVNTGYEEFDNIDDKSFYNLFHEISSLEFEYLGKSENEEYYEWQQSWDAKEERSLPRAVKIVLNEKDKEGDITVIVPILLEIYK